jgi:hypothetical protein
MGGPADPSADPPAPGPTELCGVQGSTPAHAATKQYGANPPLAH